MARFEAAVASVPEAQLKNERLNQRELHAGATLLRSWPTRAWLSVTGKCNLLCTHCPRSLVDEQFLSSDEMTPSVFQRVKQEVFPWLALLRVGGNNLGEQLFAKSWNTAPCQSNSGADCDANDAIFAALARRSSPLRRRN